MTEDSINVKIHKAKVKIEVVAANLAYIGLEGICTRLKAIVKELDDIEDVMGWIHQGVDFSESQKIISKQLSEMRSENNVKD